MLFDSLYCCCHPEVHHHEIICNKVQFSFQGLHHKAVCLNYSLSIPFRQPSSGTPYIGYCHITVLFGISRVILR
nr:MAG TPA: hypothetical protein [Caudoviricetes sp.]